MHARALPCCSLFLALAFLPSALAQQVPVRSPQGTTHGFLCLDDEDGKSIGYGDAVQTVRGSRVTSRLTLHFSDGSLDDETTVFTQDRDFHFVSDHHVQRGTFFSKPLDLTLKANGEVTQRSHDHEGPETIEATHVDLPANIANGMVPVLLLNAPPHTAETKLSMLVPYGKGRVVDLKIRPDGTQPFTAGGAHRMADILLIHLELGGPVGVVAHILGKQPPDAHLWMESGEAPQLLRMDSQLAEGGPVVSIRLAGVTFTAPHPAPESATLIRPAQAR